MTESPAPPNSSTPATPGSPRPGERRRWLIMATVIMAPLLVIVVLYALAPKVTAPRSTPSPTASVTGSPSAMQVSAGKTPATAFTLPAGFVVHVFADGLTTARDLVFSPGGTLLVSDIKGGRVLALPDADHNGVADRQIAIVPVAEKLHGLAFHGDDLFVAGPNQVNRYRWNEKSLTATFDRTILKLPNHGGHTSRTMSISSDGTLYLTVASSCNVCRETDDRLATILVSNINGDNPRVFAKGLRNAAFSTLHPTTGELWATENGRDNLGDNLPPDEINIVRSGQDYGWPICYGTRVHDTKFDTAKYITDPCASTQVPLYQVPAHNAPLGLTFIKSNQFPADQQGDLLVAYHGSWNRSVPDGYKVVRLTVRGNTITGSNDFMTGFIQGRNVPARPVDLTFDSRGNLYLSDDQTGTVYIIQHPGGTPSR